MSKLLDWVKNKMIETPYRLLPPIESRYVRSAMWRLRAGKYKSGWLPRPKSLPRGGPRIDEMHIFENLERAEIIKGRWAERARKLEIRKKTKELLKHKEVFYL